MVMMSPGDRSGDNSDEEKCDESCDYRCEQKEEGEEVVPQKAITDASNAGDSASGFLGQVRFKLGQFVEVTSWGNRI